MSRYRTKVWTILVREHPGARSTRYRNGQIAVLACYRRSCFSPIVYRLRSEGSHRRTYANVNAIQREAGDVMQVENWDFNLLKGISLCLSLYLEISSIGISVLAINDEQ